MNLEIESIISIINKTNAFLANACAVQESASSSATKDIISTKQEQKAAEKLIQNECYNKTMTYEDLAQKRIDGDKQTCKEIESLHNKLKSVDKAYTKRANAISFAGVTDEFKKELIILINGSEEIGEDILKRIYKFYKDTSYRYIAKPVSILVSATKKSKLLYDQLAACIWMLPELKKNNERVHIDERDEKIKSAKEDESQQIFNIRRRYDSRLTRLMQNANEDNEFVVEESQNTLKETFGEDFKKACRLIKDRVSERFLHIYDNDGFVNEIYVGDVAWKLDQKVLDNPIGENFVNENHDLCEEGIAFLPWTMTLSNCKSIFISPENRFDREGVISWINQYIYSFIRQLPLNGIELSVFDPENRGNSIFPFLNLPMILPDMFSKKIFTSTEDINNRIQEINQYVDSIIQQKLSNKYNNVFEYNQATPENPLPIKLLCLFDFPKCFEGRAFDNIISIIKNASRCGLFVVMAYSPNELKAGFGDATSILQSIKDESICLVQSNGVLRFENTGLAVLPMELPQQNKIDAFCVEYERACQKKLARGIPFLSVVKDGEFFTKKSAEFLSLPIGKGDGSVTQCIEFGKRSSHHSIITGATGSGKSTLLHTLIMSSIINYSPDELNLYLMDFKSGTEFKVYETVKVPHIKLLALDALQEFGESILMELVEEQKRRSQLFKDNGEHTNLKSYVSSTGQVMPRILVVMDEFQILFNDSANRKVAVNCAELANKIVTEGRAYGIHLIMATQTLRSIREKTALSQSTIEQMRIRIGLKCGEEDANYIFGDANARDALMKMKGAIGTAVYNPEYTEANNSGFRVAYCSDTEQKSLLTSIAGICKGKYETTTKVFEGKRVPEFPLDKVNQFKENVGTDVVLDIGEPIKIEAPISIVMSKRKNNNLLIVGSDVNLMSQMIANITYELALQPTARTHYLDGNAFCDEPLDPFVEKVCAFSDNFNVISTRKDCLLCVEELYEEFKKRRKSTSSSTEKHVVIVNGLQYIDILSMMLKGDYINREDYIDADYSELNPVDDVGLDTYGLTHDSSKIEYGAAIKELIESGYAFGIYFVFACNEFQTVREVLHYGAGILNKFTNRVVFAVSDKDSDELIDGIKASGMNSITAVYSDSIKKILQFKPYAKPNIENIIKGG